MKSFIEFSPEVANAIRLNKPLVALESTIITHGLPYPENVAMALKVEAIVREHGAIPATIAILNGRIHVGLTSRELEQLAQYPSPEKVSRRDLASVLTSKKDGGTTVATTMWVASVVGIRVFATGGIGGVHRGAQLTFDISSDLEEFSSTPVVVVSAGAKAILDLPKTLEYLETKGVPVIGYQTNEFPAFYYTNSGLMLKTSVSTVRELANIVHVQWQLHAKQGILVANPIPKAYALEKQLIEAMIRSAIDEANIQGVVGYALTPFLLAKIKQISDGESVKSNLELVFNNARVASDLAVALQAFSSVEDAQ
jgi:pseudouridine-5'-phosphate glycosidase